MGQNDNLGELRHLFDELHRLFPGNASVGKALAGLSHVSEPDRPTANERSEDVGQERSLLARAALEAMRAGVVNRAVVRHATYGRDAELNQLLDGFSRSPAGSTQVLVGQYGSGKSHLCELLASAAEEKGYAVVRLEMGSSSSPAEHPRSLVAAIPRSFAVQIDGRRYAGRDDLAVLLRALHPGGLHFTAERELLGKLYREIPGRANLALRFDRLRRAIPSCWAAQGAEHLPDLPLHYSIPDSMTAVNYAANRINWLAHELRHAGVPGLVLILDEAERAQWSTSNYRIERAVDVMLGLALVASNKDTSRLKHYLNQRYPAYLSQAPSYLHAVFAFTHQWGLCGRICAAAGVVPMDVSPFDQRSVEGLVGNIYALYKDAYGSKVRFPPHEIVQMVRVAAVSDGTREMVRRSVAAMDHRRLLRG